MEDVVYLIYSTLSVFFLLFHNKYIFKTLSSNNGVRIPTRSSAINCACRCREENLKSCYLSVKGPPFLLSEKTFLKHPAWKCVKMINVKPHDFT